MSSQFDHFVFILSTKKMCKVAITVNEHKAYQLMRRLAKAGASEERVDKAAASWKLCRGTVTS